MDDMAVCQRWKCQRRQNPSREINIYDFQLYQLHDEDTCVPPSPGRVLYHKLLWGPAIGFWLGSPWENTTAAEPITQSNALGKDIDYRYTIQDQLFQETFTTQRVASLR